MRSKIRQPQFTLNVPIKRNQETREQFFENINWSIGSVGTCTTQLEPTFSDLQQELPVHNFLTFGHSALSLYVQFVQLVKKNKVNYKLELETAYQTVSYVMDFLELGEDFAQHSIERCVYVPLHEGGSEPCTLWWTCSGTFWRMAWQLCQKTFCIR